MKSHQQILNWAAASLISKGYTLQRTPEIVQETPWSVVIQLSTLKGDLYLKQTPADLAIEPKIMELLADQFHVSVPTVIARNDNLHCFLMKDAGLTLRQYLKSGMQPDLIYEAILQFTDIQRVTENDIKSLLALGVPDWRLDKLPTLYDQLISQTELLKADGVTDKELKILHDLSSKVAEECEQLSHYKIPETLVQPDFNTNNILIDAKTKKMTLIDLGEIVITHPFFSLHNFLHQATIHHDVKELNQLQDTCLEDWLELATRDKLVEAFKLSKKLWPIYSALAYYRLIMSVDSQALKHFYAERPNRLANFLREYQNGMI